MFRDIKNRLFRIGVDKAVFYTVAWRGISALGGICSVFFIAKYLSASEQGYFYTFSSLIAVQFFFELGFSYVITPFVAHENSFLHWNGKSKFNGPDKNISRLSSLLRFTLKWFSILSAFSFITISSVGYIFFNYYQKEDVNVDWLVPYLLLSFVSSASLNTIPILAYFEGLGKVKEVVKVRIIQQIIYLSLLFIFFIAGFKLYASPLASIAGFLFVVCYLLTSDRIIILKLIWKKLGIWTIPYKTEIFPFQWKIAVSLMSSYLMYQLFNPILFANEGPVVAGQMGLSLTVLTGIYFIAFASINTKLPLFTNLVAANNIKELDRVYKNSFIFSVVLNVVLILLMIAFVSCCNYYGYFIGYKFLPLTPLSLLAIGILCNNIISALGIYFRAYKEEPFFLLSIIIAALNSIFTVIFGQLVGVIGITSSFAMLTVLFGLTSSLIMFKKKRMTMMFLRKNIVFVNTVF